MILNIIFDPGMLCVVNSMIKNISSCFFKSGRYDQIFGLTVKLGIYAIFFFLLKMVVEGVHFKNLKGATLAPLGNFLN